MDYYETLQVAPSADEKEIEAAYRRILDQYDPQRLNGVADELVQLALQKRAAADQAFAVLGDTARRAAYDARRAAGPEQPATQPTAQPATQPATQPAAPSSAPGAESPLDYRPLPPAMRSERPRGFDEQPTLPSRRPHVAPGLALLIVAAAVVLPSLVVGLVLTGGGATPPPAATPTASPADQFEALISQARGFAEQNPGDARAWVDYANLLYDSAQIVREQSPDSVLYQQRLPRWLDAIDAYSKALAIEPDNTAVLADRGASACFYGAGAGEPRYLERGLGDTSAALEQSPDDPRVLLSHGYCLVSVTPPRTEEAIAGWSRIPSLVPADSPLVNQANLLIQQYSTP